MPIVPAMLGRNWLLAATTHSRSALLLGAPARLLGSYFTATLIVSFPTSIWKRFPAFVPSPAALVAA